MTPTSQATGPRITPPEPINNPTNKKAEPTNHDRRSTSHVHPLKKVEDSTSPPTSTAQHLKTQLSMLTTLEL
jgi:hypothetical protein